MRHTILAIAMASAVSLALAAAGQDEPAPRQYTSDEVASMLEAHIQGDALGALVILNELRAGRTNTVLEMLEFQVDAAVTTAQHRKKSGTPEQKRRAEEFLSAVSEYRSRHPRRTEAVLDDGPMQEHLERTTKKAVQIIEKRT